MREYMYTLDELAREMVKSGALRKKIDEMAIPEPFDDWLFAAFFPLNMHFLYQRQSRKREAMFA
jgi:hypothetical protein